MLTDKAIKALKPKAKPYRQSDGGNMFIKVAPSGTKTFELEYRSPTTRKIVRKTIGKYPLFTLAEARQIALDLKVKLAHGTDPHAATLGYTFAETAERYLATKPPHSKEHGRLKNHLLPHFAALDISKITPQSIITAIKPLEKAGKIETARRVFVLLSAIFKSAAEYTHNPCDRINYAYTFAKHTPKNYPALLDTAEIRALLLNIEGYHGDIRTKIALQTALFTALRPGNVRALEWSEVDLNAATLTISAAKMKMKRDFTLPLSKYVTKMIQENRDILGQRWLFGNSRAMSDNTMTAALRRMGYTGSEIVPHGFRAMFSTLAHDHGKDSRIIEKCLAHADSNAIRAIYNRSAELNAMREVMEWWSEFLLNLKA